MAKGNRSENWSTVISLKEGKGRNGRRMGSTEKQDILLEEGMVVDAKKNLIRARTIVQPCTWPTGSSSISHTVSQDGEE